MCRKLQENWSNGGHSVKVVTLSDVPYDNKKYPFAVIRIKRSLFKPLRFLKTIYKIIESSRQADAAEKMLEEKFVFKNMVDETEWMLKNVAETNER